MIALRNMQLEQSNRKSSQNDSIVIHAEINELSIDVGSADERQKKDNLMASIKQITGNEIKDIVNKSRAKRIPLAEKLAQSGKLN